MMWAFFITLPSSSRMALMNWVSQIDTSTARVYGRAHARSGWLSLNINSSGWVKWRIKVMCMKVLRARYVGWW